MHVTRSIIEFAAAGGFTLAAASVVIGRRHSRATSAILAVTFAVLGVGSIITHTVL